MKVIILAAGRGSRMGKSTEELPKCMVKLWGKTLIDMCISTLNEGGISNSDIGIVTGYHKEKINIDNVCYFHNDNWENTNMVMSLFKASEWLKQEDCIVCYSDIVFHKNAIKALIECDKDVAITYYTNFMKLWNLRFENPLDDLESFIIDKNNYVLEIGKKVQDISSVQGQFMGLVKFTPKGWKQVEKALEYPTPKPIEKLDMTTLLNHMINLGYSLYGIKTTELWLECDNENDCRLYEEKIKEI